MATVLDAQEVQQQLDRAARDATRGPADIRAGRFVHGSTTGLVGLPMNNTNNTAIRRFGCIEHKGGGKFDSRVFTREIDAKMLQEFEELTSVIFELQPILIAYQIVEKNYAELVEGFQRIHTKLEVDIADKPFLINAKIESNIEIVRLVSNFLASTSSFLNQTETHLNRLYGKTNDQIVKCWKVKKNTLHAAHFSYRFVYELRNFGQHCELPISNFTVNSKRNAVDGRISVSAEITLNRDALLETYDWKKLKTELKGKPEQLVLLPLLDDFLVAMKSLFEEAVSLQLPRIWECVHYFRVLYERLKIPTDSVPVIWVGTSDDPAVPPGRMEIIPVEQLAIIARAYTAVVSSRTQQA